MTENFKTYKCSEASNDMQIVFVLTSGEQDPFLEQFYIAVESLRYFGNKLPVTLVTDETTLSKCQDGTRKKMLDAADNVIAVDLDRTLSGKIRSRLLKTGLREYVKGDYLYVDTDIIFCKNIEEDLKSIAQIELGAVDNLNIPWDKLPWRQKILDSNKVFDLSAVTDFYNGGMMWCKDTAATHEFYSQWRKTYLEGLAKGCDFDQPSLETVQLRTGLISRLDGSWNVQGSFGVRFFRNAKIFHYYSDEERQPVHFLRNTESIKQIAAGYIAHNENSIKKLHSLFNDFLKGYESPSWVVNLEPDEPYYHPMYWFVKNHCQKRYFRLFDRMGAMLNKLLPPPRKSN